MPDTGLFQIMSFDARPDADGGIERINAVTAQCQKCGKVNHARGDELQRVPGGTVLTCRHCDNRQALSNARFGECHAHSGRMQTG